MNHKDLSTEAGQAYQEYARHLDFRNFRGDSFPLARFSDLPPHTQKAWVAAVSAIIRPKGAALRETSEINTLAYQLVDVVFDVVERPGAAPHSEAEHALARVRVREILEEYLNPPQPEPDTRQGNLAFVTA